MKRIEILVAGNNEISVKTIADKVNTGNGWIITEATTVEDAIEKFHRQDLDVVIFSNDITNEDERKLDKIFSIQNPDIVIIRHNNNENHLLNDRINNALNKQRLNNKASFSFTDDALKNAGLNIVVE